jgi:uncharacterized protein YdcH (DUF465 family)
MNLVNGSAAEITNGHSRESLAGHCGRGGLLMPRDRLWLMHKLFHHLADELPEYREDINHLSARDPRFQELMARYREVDHQIRLADENIEPKCDETVEMFKRQRLALMDEMVHLIRVHRPVRVAA